MVFKNYSRMNINGVYAEMHRLTALKERYMEQFNANPSAELNQKIMHCRMELSRCEDIIRKYKKKARVKPWEEEHLGK